MDILNTYSCKGVRPIHKIIRAKHEHLNDMVHVLNTATRDLLEKGVQQWEYPWDRDVIDEEILNNQAYVILDEDTVIAVFFIRTIEAADNCPAIMKENHLYLYRIAIRPDYQGMGVGEEVCGAAFSIAKEANKNIYLDCWEGNKKLRFFYTQTGFIYCGDFPENDYWISVFKFEPTLNM